MDVELWAKDTNYSQSAKQPRGYEVPIIITRSMFETSFQRFNKEMLKRGHHDTHLMREVRHVRVAGPVEPPSRARQTRASKERKQFLRLA